MLLIRLFYSLYSNIMNNNFKKIITLWLLPFLLLWLGFITHAEETLTANAEATTGAVAEATTGDVTEVTNWSSSWWGWWGGPSSRPSNSSQKISAPKFNGNWNINWNIYRVCWWLPQHAKWNTWAANSNIVYSYYWDLMPVSISLLNISELLGVLTARTNPDKCPILCEEWYLYDSENISCIRDPEWTPQCNDWYIKVWWECKLAQKEITINNETCNNKAPANAHYLNEKENVRLIADWTYSSPVCNWECNEWYTNVNWTCYLSQQEISCNVEYYSRANTNTETVIAILTWCNAEITWTDTTHTFTENWNYTFNFRDYVGNTGSVIATVDWIWCKTDDFNWELNKCNIENLCDINAWNNNNWNINTVRTSIYCYDKNITSIAAGTFNKFYNVDYISIYSNSPLTSISKDAFKGLNNIKGITLRTWDYTLPESLFNWLTSLESLSIWATEYPKDVFKGLTNLKYLNIWYTWDYSPTEWVLPLWLFSWLNNLESLSIIWLTNIPVWIFDDVPNLKTLNLWQNWSISASLINWLTNLEWLYINDWPILVWTTISEWLISNLNNLKYLSIGWVSDIPQLTTKNLNTLENVSIYNFNTISDNVFSNMPNLKYININEYENTVTTLDSNIFTWLSNLESLYLYMSWLESLPWNLFNWLTNLKNLSVNNTDITSFAEWQFNNLTSLESLQLYDNKILTLSWLMFNWLTNLKNLYLNNNKISYLPINLFSWLTNLVNLYIDNNQISSIPMGIFDWLSNLKYLWLWYNKISSLSKELFSDLTNLTYLWLYDNQLSNIIEWINEWHPALRSIDYSRNCIPSRSNQKLCFIPNYSPIKGNWTASEVIVSLTLTGDQTLYNKYSNHFTLPSNVTLTQNWSWEFNISNLESHSSIYRYIENYGRTWDIHFPSSGKIPYLVDWIWNNAIEPNLSLTNTLSAEEIKRSINNTDDLTILDWIITGNSANFNTIEIEWTFSNSLWDDSLEFYAEIDWNQTDSVTFSDNKAIISIEETTINKSLPFKLHAVTNISEEKRLTFKVRVIWSGTNFDDIVSNYINTKPINFIEPTANIQNLASSTVFNTESYWQIYDFKINVSKYDYTLNKIVISVTTNKDIDLSLNDFDLYIDWNSELYKWTYNSNSWTFSFTIPSLVLEQNINHSIIIKTNLSEDLNDTIFSFSRIELNNWDVIKDILWSSSRRYIVPTYPTLSVISSSDNELRIRISNGSGYSESFWINWIWVNDINNVDYFAFNGQVVDSGYFDNETNMITIPNDFELSWNDSVDFIIMPKIWTTVRIDWIWIRYNNKIYKFTSEYTNITAWANLKITWKS